MKKITFLGMAAGLSVAAQGAFLDDLAAQGSRVGSSPFAAGGDVILKISDVEYVHVFTNAAPDGTYAFVPSVDMTCRVLAVAGGGGGGTGYGSHGGGGGAGGMLEAEEVVFAKDTEYAVTVGAGGAKTTGNDIKRGGSGTASSVNGLSAVGGGGGGSYQNGGGGANNGCAGGSGGGGGGDGSTNGTGGSGTAGQGHAGGKGYPGDKTNSACSGGGGGAGGAGADCLQFASTASIAGDGGPGRTTDILGFDQMFAGGGAGGGVTGTQAHGGTGGGGNGAYSSQKNASDGTDGLGGGGGGAGGSSYSGRGGSGIVVLRYWLPTSASVECLASAGWLGTNRTSVFTHTFRSYVPDGGTVSATFEIAPTTNAAAKTSVVVATDVAVSNKMSVTFTNTVAGLAANVAYTCTWKLSNSGGATDELTDIYTMAGYTCDPVISGIGAADYAVRHDFDGSDEIYIFTNARKRAVFTPQSDGFVRLLLVGGGGAGFSRTPMKASFAGGGGGGGGGVVYVGEYAVYRNVDYPIVVGAGATALSSWVKAVNGGDSSFGDVVAWGGGSGGGDNKAGGTGGSGGGGADNAAAGSAKDGQGHNGGKGTSAGMAGGGGGAGAAGVAATASKAGDGGAGASYDLSGEAVIYAGGGGGGTSGYEYVNGAGGAGGGGAGASKSTSAQAGTDGLGGGGGGGNQGGNPEATSYAAGGGSGVVIVRFTDISKLTNDPKFTARVVSNSATSVSVEVDVTYFGADCDSVSVTANYGYATNDLAYSRVLATDHTATAVYTLSGLSPGRTYYLEFVAANAKGGSSRVGCFEVTTPGGGLAASVTRTHEGYTYNFAFTLASLGTGTVSARLHTGLAGALEACETLDVTAVGTHSIAHTYSADWDARTVYAYIEVTESEAGYSWTQQTTILSFKMTDNTAYCFSAEGGVGDWFDPSTWTPTPVGKGRGYPGEESVVTFPGYASSEVRIGASVRPGGLSMSGLRNATVVFRGTADNVQIVDVRGESDYIVGAGSTCIVDHAAINFNSTSWPKFSSNQAFILRNGASYSYSGGIEMECCDGGYLAVESGSTFAASGILQGRPTARIRVDDATVSVGNFLPGVKSGTEAMRLEIAGANPRFSCSGGSAANCPVEMLFDIPAETQAWTNAPVRSSGGFCAGSRRWTVRLPGKGAVKLSKFGRARDIPLIYAAGGITTGNVVFGTSPIRNSGFVFSADNKTLYYRYAPPLGTRAVVR